MSEAVERFNAAVAAANELAQKAAESIRKMQQQDDSEE